MSTNIEKLYEDLLQLSEDERAQVAASLIDSLDPVRDSNAGAAWEAEIERRLAELDNGSVKIVSWPDARRLILKNTD